MLLLKFKFHQVVLYTMLMKLHYWLLQTSINFVSAQMESVLLENIYPLLHSAWLPAPLEHSNNQRESVSILWRTIMEQRKRDFHERVPTTVANFYGSVLLISCFLLLFTFAGEAKSDWEIYPEIPQTAGIITGWHRPTAIPHSWTDI